ncbi:HNH endonuclease signature motif containing protein [Microbacterium sp. SLBN-146]|uniref:HNH endonuclease signature motif containing protein n=1 Tax=Microbacterium sp. SLBN-146 TaxID=2768457 RepID=UPI0011549F09|nr:HNH endonuclease signature motif containing protein [Microbacterium sp. SLBN-146]TQJ30901.1 uncharacterized protein DUF222 [Microbacterium sp. SLBN-146]
MTERADALLRRLPEIERHLADLLSPALANDDARAMTDAQLVEFVRLVESLGRRVDAARLIVASEVDDRCRPERGAARLCERMGCGSAVELLTSLTGIRTTTARHRTRAARPIASTTSLTGDVVPAPFPRLRAALDDGLVGLDTVAVITTTLGPIVERCHPAGLAAAEEALVADAVGTPDTAGLDAESTLVQARVWSLALDPDGVLPEYERAERRRGLVLGRVRDGLVPLRGELLPDVAAQLQQLIHAHLSPRVADRTSDATRGPVFVDSEAMSSDDAEPSHDLRTRSQKQHDVLASVLAVAARAAETPTLGGAAPTLLVTISAEDLETQSGVAFIDGTDQPLPARVARQIACAGGTQHAVYDETGRIISLGSPHRVFTAHQRRAIMARDGGCVIPGCHVPAFWCEVHHALEHSRGGPTHTDNGMLLCWHHHRTLETSGWAVRMTDGVPEVRAPSHIDRSGAWLRARGSAHLQRERTRRRRDGCGSDAPASAATSAATGRPATARTA